MADSWLIEKIRTGKCDSSFLQISQRSNGYCYKEYFNFYRLVKIRISKMEYDKMKQQMTSTPNHKIITPK